MALGAVVAPSSVFAGHSCTTPPYTIPVHEASGASVCRALDGRSAEGGTITTFAGLLNRINLVLNTIVPFLVGIAVFIVIWGVFKYIASAAEEEKRVEARAFIVWGIVGIFAMVSVWGFVNIMVNSFDLSTRAPSAQPNLPPIPGAN